MNQRALVTGGTGFVGSHIVKRLVREGCDVHCIVRANSDLTPLKGVKDVVAFHVHDGTTKSMQTIVAIAQPNVVFHLASVFVAEHEAHDVDSLIESNILFGTQIAEAASLQNVRWFVNTSTSWQHFENQPYCPVNLYAATKQAFEDILKFFVDARGLQVVTLELFDTYGPDDPRPKLINLLKHIAVEHKQLEMSPGEQLIDLVYIDDVVEAYIVAAERLVAMQVAGHERYVVSSGAPIRLRELVRLVSTLLGQELKIDWGQRPYRGREVMTPWQLGDILPNWRPRVSLHEGMMHVLSNLSGSN